MPYLCPSSVSTHVSKIELCFFAVQLQYDLGIDTIQTKVVSYVTLVVIAPMYLLVCGYYVEMCYEERYVYLCMYMKHPFGCHHWI